MVQIKRPPVDVNPSFHDLQPGDTVLRIHRRDPAGNEDNPLSFRKHGPTGRFDHHDGVSDRSVLYTVPVISSRYEALVNCFVGISELSRFASNLNHLNLCSIKITRKLRLLDLRSSGAMRAGTVAAISSVSDLTFSQAWSRFFYESEDLYTKVDGLIYSSPYDSQPFIVFYDRAFDSLGLVEDLPLNHPKILPDVHRLLDDLRSLPVDKAFNLSAGLMDFGESKDKTSSPKLDVDTADGETFDFLDRCINAAVSSVQRELLVEEIGYVYSRDNMLIRRNSDGSEELVQYLLDLAPTERGHNTSTKV